MGLSPFAKERTPSFFVNDAKQRWFDFSAGKDGDIFAFLMETEGLSFVEAVERLAHEAGLTIPENDPEERKREVRRLTLIEVLEEAQSFFISELTGDAREYLKDRGISQASIDQFGIGFATKTRDALKRHLAKVGVDPDLAAEAGLLIAGEGIPVSYDRFRGRITIPIRDPRGRLVGFGGRVLPAESQESAKHLDQRPPAKYINSPESAVFHKGETIFNAHAARQPAHDGAELIVTEGYMNAVTAVAHGFPATVCTMGTALTERQLLGLWTMADVPILCFDGDEAGQRAKAKAIATAFPLLKPGRSLRFAAMPTGMDPDEVIRKRGADSFRQAVEAATGLADQFWLGSTRGLSLASPEAQAKLEAEMIEQVKTIPDVQLRDKYQRNVRDRIRNLPRRTMVVRSNGHSNHSTSPSSIRLSKGLQDGGEFSLREAAMIIDLASAPLDGDQESMEIAGVSERTRNVISEILYLVGSVPAEELLAAVAAKVPAVSEARALLRSAGLN